MYYLWGGYYTVTDTAIFEITLQCKSDPDDITTEEYEIEDYEMTDYKTGSDFSIVVSARTKEEAIGLMYNNMKSAFEDSCKLSQPCPDITTEDVEDKYPSYNVLDIGFLDFEDMLDFDLDRDIKKIHNVKELSDFDWGLADEPYGSSKSCNYHLNEYKKLLKDIDCEGQLYLFKPDEQYIYEQNELKSFRH